MNKFKKILISIIAVLMLTATSIYAAEPQLEIIGDSEAKAGETKTLTVKLVSEELMGTVSGKVIGDANVSDLKVSGKNDWNLLAYREGSFNLVKTAGGKNEDVLEITYTIKPEATDKVNITLNNISITDLNYETTKIADISKDISIKIDEIQDDNNNNNNQNNDENDETKDDTNTTKELSSIEITKAPSKVNYKAGEKFSKDGMEITAKYSDGTSKVVTDYTYTPNGELTEKDTKITISYTENGVAKSVEQSIKVTKKSTNTTNSTNTANTPSTTNKTNTQNITTNSSQKDTTVANKVLSNAGIGNYVFYGLVIVTILGIVFYIKYRKMYNVK